MSIKRSGNYNLRSSSDGLLLATPTYRGRVTLGDRSFHVATPALWNVLPRKIRSITVLGIFKCHLKTHLFRETFIDFYHDNYQYLNICCIFEFYYSIFEIIIS